MTDSPVPAGTPAARRRKVALELVSLVVPTASAVFFSTLVVVGWSTAEAGLAAGTSGAVLAGAWSAYRCRWPASTAPWDDSSGSGFEDHIAEDAEDRRPGVGSTLVAVAIMSVIALVAVATRFLPAWTVVALVAVGVTDSDLGDVVLAVLATLAVALVAELGLVAPVSRRWDLSTDEPVLPFTRSGPSAPTT